MSDFATVQDIIDLRGPLTAEEIERATAAIPIVCNALRWAAYQKGKNLDQMIEDFPYLVDVAKSITVDVVKRYIDSSTNEPPMTQTTQSAMGYSFTGTYLVAGGGLFIKNSELKMLGLRRQKVGVIELYDGNTGNNYNTDS